MQRTNQLITLAALSIGCSQTLCGQESDFIERFETTNGALAFGEFATPTPGTVGYYVDVISDISIFAAAFSFQFDPDAVSTSTFVTVGGGTGWTGNFIDASSWDAGSLLLVNGNPIMSNDLGSFSSLFGTLDDMVVVFSSDGLAPLTEATDIDEANWLPENFPSFIRNGGDPATHGVFMDDKGNVVASTIPEPSAAVLLSLAGLGLFARRRRA